MQVPGQNITRPLERFCAILAVAVCLILTFAIWKRVSAYQAMWPLPGLYFIEMAGVSTFGAFSFVRGWPTGTVITWGAAGAFSAFSILGAWSVGFFYLPIALLFTAISVTSDVRNRRNLLPRLGVFLFTGRCKRT